MDKYIHVKKANFINLEEKRFDSLQLLLKKTDGKYSIAAKGNRLDVSLKGDDSCLVYNAKGEYIIPGFVDMQCVIGDFQSRDFSQKWSELVCAMAGGYSTVCPVPVGEKFFEKKENVKAYLKELKSFNGIKVIPCLPVPKKRGTDKSFGISAIAEAGVGVLSDCAGKYIPSESMREVMKECHEYGMLLICGAHDMSLVGDGCVNEGKMSRYFKLEGISFSSELISVSRNIILAKETGCRIHIPNVSLAMSVELIRMAKNMGVNVTASTAPQYFCCNENELLYRGAKAKLYPPLRSENDVEEIIEGIVDGTIDCISTDHIPQPQGHKKDLKTAKFGSVGFETAFSACYTHLVATGRVSIFRLVDAMSVAPRRILYGVADDGNIDGYISVDTDGKRFYTKNSVKAVHWNSIFDGRDLSGVVTRNFNTM